MKKKNIIQLDPSSVHVRLGMCAAALVGTAAAVPDADANIITFNTPIPIPATFGGVYVNLGTGASAPLPFAGWDFNPYQQPSLNLGFFWATTPAGSYGGVAATTTGPYLNLTVGTVVSSSSTFSITITATNPNYLQTGTEILGFRFFNETTSAVDYGYLRMSTTASTGFPATILSWSYEDNGGPITVVPEPSTVALLTISALAAGAIGLRKWRRQCAA